MVEILKTKEIIRDSVVLIVSCQSHSHCYSYKIVDVDHAINEAKNSARLPDSYVHCVALDF